MSAITDIARYKSHDATIAHCILPAWDAGEYVSVSHASSIAVSFTAQRKATVQLNGSSWSRGSSRVDHDGALAAIRHEIVNSSALLETHFEPSSETSKCSYACPAITTKQQIERVSINLPTAMRAPVEGPGTWALESAMDELAVALKMDPLDLRLRNYAETDPHTRSSTARKPARRARHRRARRDRCRGCGRERSL